MENNLQMWPSKRIKQPGVREEKIQQQVCEWMKRQYPKVIFTCDLSSGMKLTIGQSVKASKMRSSRGLPDLMIFEPKGIYKGLILELKRKDVNIFRRDGELISDQHVREQADILARLREKGYAAMFSCGVEKTIENINNYMSLK